MTFPYCTITQVQQYFKDLEKFDSRETINDWTKTAGQTNVYEFAFSGYHGIVYEDGQALGEQISIADVDSNAGSFYYNSDTNILYIHTTGSIAPVDNEIQAAPMAWDDFLTYMMNNAFMDLESYIDSKFPRPLPMAIDQYNNLTYDSAIIDSAIYLTISKVIQSRDPENPLWEKYLAMVWDKENESGILWEYKNGDRSFSFETTADQFNGNIKQLIKGTTSTGVIQLVGSGDRSSREKIYIKITTAGEIETAKFQYSTDMKATWSDEIYCTIAYVPLIDDIYLKFSGTFVEDDEWLVDLIGGKEKITNPAFKVINIIN